MAPGPYLGQDFRRGLIDAFFLGSAWAELCRLPCCCFFFAPVCFTAVFFARRLLFSLLSAQAPRSAQLAFPSCQRRW